MLRSESGAFSMNALTDCGFLMDGTALSQWITHTIDLLNTVNGRPVLYTSGANFAYILASAFGQVILADSQSATIAGADIRHATSPIILGFCSSSIVTASNCSDSNVGITVLRSTGTIIESSSMWNNDYGISLSLSPDSVISNCTLGDDPTAGIFALQSLRMTTTNVTMFRSGFWLEGFTLNDFGSHSIGTDTLVNGKPVYYLVDQTGITIPFPAGQVILANCSDIVISDQELSGSCIGVHINFSKNITVSNVTSNGNLDGLEMLECTDSIVENSTFSNNVYGVVADGSTANIFRANNVSNSSSWGFYFSGSTSRNIVQNNTISYNSGSGTVYDPLKIQAFDSGSVNSWNSTTGGNYWSDWTAPDDNGNGIVDLPYFMDGSLLSSDMLPLTTPPPMIPEFAFAMVAAASLVLAVLILVRGRRKGD
jgi:parallel beta-helix repeat protein